MATPTSNGTEAPRDTSAIAAHALESLEQSQSSPAADPPAPSSQPGPAQDTAAQTAAAQTEEIKISEGEQLLREAGYVSERKPDGREHWIPRSKVLSMIESGLKKRGATLDKEREAWTSEKTTLAQQAQQAQAFRTMMQNDPQALLRRMADIDPRYRAFLEPQQQQPALPRQEEDPEPQPDLDLGNGRSTYSLDGLRKRDAWMQRRMERAFDQKIKPFADARAAEERRQAQAQFDARILEKSTAQYNRAKTWPKFTELEPQILKVLQEDTRKAEANGTLPELTVYDAYMQIAGPLLTSDHNAIRETVMKELQNAPRSTSMTTNGAEPMKAPASMSTQEIARRAMAKLEGRG